MLTVINVWPTGLVMLVLLLLAMVVARVVPFYRQLILPTSKKVGPIERFSEIDGLRGFLATGVFFSHAASQYFYYGDGKWDWPPSRFYTLAGQVPVIIFFMITGFLFWNKALNKPLNVWSFYRARFLRIMPLYGLLVVFVLFAAGVHSRFALQEPLAGFLREIARLIIPGQHPMPMVNGFDARFMMMMSWTLFYECLFYLIFPLLALCTLRRRFRLLCASAGVIYVATEAAFQFIDQLPQSVAAFVQAMLAIVDPRFFILFILGMLAAQALRVMPKLASERRLATTLIAGTALVALGRFCDGAYTPLGFALSFVVFFCITCGADFFGLLVAAPARLLGTISYSVYLLHMTVLFLVLKCVDALTPIRSMDAWHYWMLTSAIGILAIAVSMFSYRFFEHPFLRLGKVQPAKVAKNSPKARNE